jgi:hypothetical protein
MDSKKLTSTAMQSAVRGADAYAQLSYSFHNSYKKDKKSMQKEVQ